MAGPKAETTEVAPRRAPGRAPGRAPRRTPGREPGILSGQARWCDIPGEVRRIIVEMTSSSDLEVCVETAAQAKILNAFLPEVNIVLDVEGDGDVVTGSGFDGLANSISTDSFPVTRLSVDFEETDAYPTAEIAELSKAVCRSLGMALTSGNSRLTSISLTNNPWIGETTGMVGPDDATGAALVAGLHQNDVMESLGLFCFNFGARTCEGLNQALASKRSKLRSLTLHGLDAMDDTCGAVLVEALEDNRMLSELGLIDCNVGLETCKGLGRALSNERSGLREIALDSSTGIDDDAGVALVRGMLNGSNLELLHLDGTRVGTGTCCALSLVLAHSGTKLHTLSLMENEAIGDGAGEALLFGLKRTKTLSSLHVRGCDLSDDVNEMLCNAGRASVCT